MKKIVLPIAAFMISLTSCESGNSKTDKNTDSVPVTKTSNTAPLIPNESANKADSNIPKLSSPEVQQLADDNTTYMKETVAAAKAGTQ
ncbi:hypothetical protein ACLOAU_16995 [Niabella sp. CJ426]|uniref:hypothetical protein n=1 Tax=Niabella sp. CJ426 TaxID=3393740 RepID=UPI003D00ED6C